MKILPALLALTVCAGCALGSGDDDASDTPRRDLAGRPTALATPGPAASGAPTATARGAATGPAGSPGSTRPGAGGGATTAAGNAGRTAPPGTAAYRSLVTLDDRQGDADLGAPAYADLVQATLADDGTHLQVTVTVRAGLPPRTADGESIGIGVDLYPTRAQRESDYQLFADGTADGWFAYLQTPKGFVRYPGTFALGGTRLVFTVPWSSVGDPRAGRVSAFVDWTRKGGGLTGNPSSSDYAPILGTATWSR